MITGFEEPTTYIGTYSGIFQNILIISNEDVKKGTAYLLDLSTIYTLEGLISVGNKIPNFIVIKDINNDITEEDVKRLKERME